MELQNSILLESSTAAAIYKNRKAALLNKKKACTSVRKHINIAQVYIDQKSFIVEAKDTDIRKVVEIVSDTSKNLSKDEVRERVHSCFLKKISDMFCGT